MTSETHDQNWERQLVAGLGPLHAPDFEAWCERHPEALAALSSPEPLVQPLPRQKSPDRRTVMTLFKWTAASLLLMGAIAWLGNGGGNLSPSAFADTIPGVDNVQTMTWTDTYYIRMTSEDGKRTWIQQDRRLNAYRHPGQYRETMLNDKGEPISVRITDNRAGRMLEINLKDKQAILKTPGQQRGDGPPFAWVGQVIRERTFGELNRVKSVSLQGKRQIDKTEANVVRAMIQIDGQSELRQDFLFDVASRRLVGISGGIPGAHFDVETAADGKNAAEETRSRMTPVGNLTHEIVLNPQIGASEFSLDPPAGYAFEKQAKPTVTEEEMTAYLGAAARFNGNQFPDSPYEAFDHEKFNVASHKDAAARTPVEQALIEIRDKLLLREIYRSPVKQFEEDQTVPKSFHYVGSGVPVGDAGRMVAWYRLRNAAKYRAVFADLSVKDVTDAELPLNLSPSN